MGRSRGSNWVRNDTCEAHKKLSQMFLDKKITPSTKPSDLWNADKDFEKYSLQVFRNNFSLLKGINGVERKLLKSKFVFTFAKTYEFNLQF